MGKFENIVIASDIDGTFLGSGSKTIPRNLEKIKYFCDNGGHFTFATGRLPIFMRKSLPYTKDVVNMPVVTGNGTCLYDFQKEVSVEDHFMTFENCMDLVRYCKELDPSLGFRGTMYDGFVVNSLDNVVTCGAEGNKVLTLFFSLIECSYGRKLGGNFVT